MPKKRVTDTSYVTLKLTWIPFKGCPAITWPHYDLHTDEDKPQNIACISTNKKGAEILRRSLCSGIMYRRGYLDV